MATKEEKSLYDKRRHAAIKDGTWKFNPDPPSYLNDVQKQVLEGTMLGDGSLYFYGHHVNAGLAIGRATRDKEYLQYEYEIFKDFCPAGIKDRENFDKRTGKTYYGSSFRTQLAQVFTDERIRWYPEGKKRVPKDIRLTPLTCAIWFCDDGSMVKYSASKNKIRLNLATDGFPKEDVEFLAAKLQETIGGNIRVYRKIDKYTIAAYHESACIFAKYIIPVFPPGMSRKSDKWEGLIE